MSIKKLIKKIYDISGNVMAYDYEFIMKDDNDLLIKSYFLYIEELLLDHQMLNNDNLFLMIKLPNGIINNGIDFVNLLTMVNKSYVKNCNCIFYVDLVNISIDSLVYHRLHKLKNMGCKICLNNYDKLGSSYQILYDLKPQFVSLSHYFNDDILNDYGKIDLIAGMNRFLKSLSIKLIYGNIDNEKECKTLKRIGVNYYKTYNNRVIIVDDIKDEGLDKKGLIRKNLNYVKPFNNESRVLDIIEIIKLDGEQEFYPIIDRYNKPLGIFLENNLKKYIYNPYGHSLLINQKDKKTIEEFVTSVPIVDVETPIEELIEKFSIMTDVKDLLVTEDGKYIGFLESKSLLNIIHDINMTKALLCNPLTSLPGNKEIENYIVEILDKRDCNHVLYYYDFNNFKSFNDRFGFVTGDKAILKFGKLLKNKIKEDGFIGHIGGDDFFAGESYKSIEIHISKVEKIIADFHFSMMHLYDDGDKSNGYYVGVNRAGVKEKIPLLGISIAVLIIDNKTSIKDINELSKRIFNLKRKAKNSDNGYSIDFLI